MSVAQTVHRTYLELSSRDQLQPAGRMPPDCLLMRATVPEPAFSSFLYTAVGGPWHWLDRLSWTPERWLAWVDRPDLETWVFYRQGTPVGFFELEAEPDGRVEIVLFGLLPRFQGQGLGGFLLTQAVHRAWALREGIRTVWLHTCSLDHPAALWNYLARGFRVFKEEDYEVDL